LSGPCSSPLGAMLARALWALAALAGPARGKPGFILYEMEAYSPNPLVIAENSSTVVIESGAGEPPLHLKGIIDSRLSILDTILLLMEVGGLPYRATLYTPGASRAGAAHDDEPSGRGPILEVAAGSGGGTVLGHTDAVIAYLADRSGLSGETPEEMARTHMVCEQIRELFGVHSHWGQMWNVYVLRAWSRKLLWERLGLCRLWNPWGTCISGQLDYAKTSNGFHPSPLQKNAMGLRWLEATLQKTGKFIMGPNISAADLLLLPKLIELENHIPEWATALELPRLREFMERIISFEAIDRYERSGRRLPWPAMSGFMTRQHFITLWSNNEFI